MNYTVSLLTKVPDCQALINIATSAKESLEYRKTGLLRQRQTASATAVEIESDLAAVDAEISALQSIIGNLPDGPTKEEISVKLTKAEYKRFLLQQRKGNYGAIALVEREYDIACIDQSITETNTFITALTERMNEVD